MSTTLLHGDCRQKLKEIDDRSVQTCVTSPPYLWLRDYGVEGQIGLEGSVAEYIAVMVEVFREVKRVLRDDGTLWLNLGDGYAQDSKWGDASGNKNYTSAAGGMSREKRMSGLGDKQLLGMPWRVAFALQDDGWILRSDIIWSKPNVMPESVKDRPTRAHEYLFLFSKSKQYYYDADAIKEPAVDGDPTAPRGLRGAVTPNAGRRDKQGESGLRRYEGFNERWGAGRSQRRRALELAREAGLTDAHIEAIRAVGITDTGKAQITQNGYGKNDPQVQALADEAKAALGGYYREFLNRDARNRRSVWTISTTPYKEAHFATFPEALVEPCILVGSSSQACEVCGAPWQRVVEKTPALADDGKTCLRCGKNHGAPKVDTDHRAGQYAVERFVCNETVTTGWQPSCGCQNSGTARCVILDPFAGSGTTLRVAERYGRDSIGIELNLSYIELQEKRTDGVQMEMFV